MRNFTSTFCSRHQVTRLNDHLAREMDPMRLRYQARFVHLGALAIVTPLIVGCSALLGGDDMGPGERDCAGCANGQNPLQDGVDEDGNPLGVLGVGWGTRYPRLSHAQYDNTVRDLLRWPEAPALSETFALDPDNQAFDTFATRTVSGNLWTDYQRAAEALAADVTRDQALLGQVAPPDTDATTFITSFGQRAFRRPLTGEETVLFVDLFNQAPELFEEGDSFARGVELVIRAMLQSPHFLYRVEHSTAAEDDRVWLSGFEIASRLSYGLWNTMPSDELLAAADAGELESESGVETWTQAMLDDPRAEDVILSFHEQLFHVSGYGSIAKSATLFPDFTLELAPVLKQEASLFFKAVSVEEDGGISELLTTPTTHVNDTTAPFYGLSGSFGSELVRVDLDPTRRAGILTQLGFLSRYASQTQSDPILRGVHLSLDYLCSDLPPPPDNVPPLPPLSDGQTNRERVADSTAELPCASCHETIINPLGFAFEHYDAIGRYRETDNGAPVDASAEYRIDGEMVAYEDAVELSAILAESVELHACYAEKWLEYVLGRSPSKEEEGVIDSLARTSLSSGGLRDLITTVTMLDTFRARPPEETSP